MRSREVTSEERVDIDKAYYKLYKDKVETATNVSALNDAYNEYQAWLRRNGYFYSLAGFRKNT